MNRLLLVTGLAALAAGPAAAQTRLDRVHADLYFTPGTASGGWSAAQVYLNATGTARPAADTVLVVNNSTTTIVPRPAGTDYDFIGVPAGTPIWQLTQGNNQASQLFLGVRSAGSGFTAWDPGNGRGSFNWLELTARKLSGPGEFAMWLDGDALDPLERLVSTANPAATRFNNRVYTVANGHDHFNYSFTEAGTYQIAFDAKANTAGGFIESNPLQPLVFTFEVVAPVPEPAAVLAVAVVGLAAARRLRGWRAEKGEREV